MMSTSALPCVLLVLVALLFGTAHSDDDRPNVTISQGTLIGQKVIYEYDTYYNFLGIPYAKPPVGDLRFKAPVPADPWNGTFEASKEGSMCKQSSNYAHMDGNFTSDEDCLYLNVYTPQIPDSENLLPVMVWIHGGSFQSGSGSYDDQGPEFLLSNGIIYVSINYRLGVFGFLSTEDAAATGNVGLKDQSLALRWVQENIAAFGGDPTKVTIAGQSAGAASTQFHLLSPMSEGLFQGVIALTESAVMVALFSMNPKEKAFQIGNILGYSGNDTQELVEFLRTVDAAELLKASDSMNTENRVELINFVPSLEPVVEGETQFLTDYPQNLLDQGKIQDVPYLTGAVDDEGMFISEGDGYVDGTSNIEDLNTNFDETFESALRVCRNEPCADELLAKMKSFYFGDGPLTNASFNNLTDLYSDFYFVEALFLGLGRLFAKNTSPIYLYQFTYDGDLAYMKERYPILKNYAGVSHGDELGYIFYFGKIVPQGSEADQVRSKFVTLWTNFIKTGNPTPESSDDFPEWPQYNNSTAYFLNINSEVTVEQNLFKRRIDFWRDLYGPYGIEY